MKIKIEIDDQIEETQIIIKTKAVDEQLQQIQTALTNISKNKHLLVIQQEKEYYLPLQDILFFETSDELVYAHSSDQMYEVSYRLYELEQFLPTTFMRISKSCIVNVSKIFSITRNIRASSLIEFQNTYKQVYVSRNYYKALKTRLEEMRNVYE